MDEATLSTLKQLAKCLAAASGCITELPDAREFDSIRAQLQSLKLILDQNREALLSRIDVIQGGNNHFPMRRSARNGNSK